MIGIVDFAQGKYYTGGVFMSVECAGCLCATKRPGL